MTIDEILVKEEKQIFERKSVNIEPKTLAITLIAFANADGGKIAIGITDRTRTVEGIDFEVSKVNELLRVPYDFCQPSVSVKIERVSCVDYMGRDNHILLMSVEPSTEVHANQADEVFLSVGDKSKKLSFEERMQLMYDRGERYFEDKAVPEATVDDIDMVLVQSYIDKIGYGKTPIEYLKENKGFLKEKNGQEQVSGAAILLFGKKPQHFFPRARVRFIRYEGKEEKFGTEMNVIKDVIFEGTVLRMIQDCIGYLDTQIKEKTYLGKDGLFVTEDEYPRFVRQEIIVNAVTHRAYSITGTDIHVKMFDNRIVVESPGKLPGLVRTDNIRYTHFSRNPKIAEFLRTYDFVKEYGEGVNRMFNELESAGFRLPEYYCNAFILQTVVYNKAYQKSVIDDGNVVIGMGNSVIEVEKRVMDSQKLSVRKIITAISEKKYNEPTRKNILHVYEAMDANQVFGAGDVRNILKCSLSTAGAVMAKLRESELVIEVKGKGKGKYRFMCEGECRRKQRFIKLKAYAKGMEKAKE